MNRTRIARTFALTLVVVLIATGSVVALADGHTPFVSRVRHLIANLITHSSTNEAPRATRLQATGERVTVQRAEGQTSSLNLRGDAEAMPTEYAAGTGVAELAAGSTRAHALASADFDEDGVPDLVSGYTGASGVGVLTLQRGNVDAIYPHSPGARERRGRGEFTGAPFQREASAYSVPEAAYFVGAGDFDADGHFDAVAARRGGRALYFLRGDGQGNLAAAERIKLPGTVTALITGEMNRRDGLTDIVVGINGDSGAGVLVFESPAGALRGQPEALSLPATASGLALGALDADSGANDLAIAAGNELLIIHGRDRRLSVDVESRAGVPEARVSRSAFEFALAGVAVGDFAGDERADVAVLSGDGAVQVLTRAGSANSAKAKMEEAKREAAQSEQAGDKSGGAAVEWQRSEGATVRVADGTPDAAGTSNVLVTTKVSSLAKDDLLLLGGGRAHVITNEAAKVRAGEKAKRGKAESFEAAVDLHVSTSVGAESELAAVLPMRLSSSALSSLVVLGTSSKAPSVVTPEAAVTFTVNSAASTDDVNRGDGACLDSAGNCSLPAAIQEIVFNSGAGPFEINFNIPGAGVPVINTSYSQIGYNISKPVIIDGTTQPAGRVQVISNRGFRIAAGNSTMRGLVINGGDIAIYIFGAGNNVIEGNYFGTNADGSAANAIPNSSNGATKNGTNIYAETSNNRIGGTTPAARNIISGADDLGVFIAAGTGNLIQGNYIGTNAAGAASIANRIGIQLGTSSENFGDNTIGGTTAGAGNLISGNGDSARGGNALYLRSVFATVQGNLFGTDASGNARIGNIGDALFVTSRGGATTIGGTTPAARNIISGSTGRGIYIDSDINFNPSSYVQGNYIGTNADGTVALPNLGHGISVDRYNITVGGAVSGAGNLISGNGGDGINVSGFFGSPGHRIQGNLIGTDVSGTLALPNLGNGIYADSTDGTLIGGTTPEARNVISGNRENGLRLQALRGDANINSNRVKVQGNYIGTNRFGTGALGNGQNGVYFFGNEAGYDIGGAAPGAGNLIAYNTEGGIVSERNYVGGAALSNSIHSNGGLGIDISDDGVTPASNQSDSNPPVLTSVNNTDAGTTITGTTSHFNNNSSFTIQFFSNPACDPSGYGEGQTLIGQTTVPAPTRYATVNFSHTISPAVPGGTIITAVAVRAPDANQPNDLYSSEFSNCAQLAAPTPTPTATPTPLQVFAIAPIRGGDNGEVTTRISGQGFQTGATVKLTRAGQTDIVAGLVSVSEQGRVLNAAFDLTGRARGLWAVVVTNPGGTSATLADAFTVEEGRAPHVWVDIVGRRLVRLGSTVTYTALVGNRGNTNAYGVPVWIAGIPKDAKVKLGFNLGRVPMPERDGGARAVDPNQIDPVIKTSTEQMLPLLMPVVPAGGVRVFQFSIEVPAVQPNFTLRTWTSPPLVKSIAGAPTPGAKDSFGLAHPYGDNIVTSDAGITCLNALFQAAVSCALSFVPGQDCLKAVLGYTSNTIGINQGSTDALSYSQFFGGAVQVANCLLDATPLLKLLDVVSCFGSFYSASQTCRDAIELEYPIRPVTSLDPNDKIGSLGAGAGHYLSGEEPLRYTIFFENKPDATAPAQEVRVIDQLDVTKFDLSTFQLGPIAFGDRVVTPPPGLSEWTTDVDLRPAKNLIARIHAKLDMATGIATWRFTSLDPATMQPTDDPLAGFLPPNRTSPEGEGNVFFTVMPRGTLQTGAEIRNRARIYFDTNEPIDTPVWLNTIDNSKPASRVAALAATQNSSTFAVNWSGTDTGAGVAGYTIYVSEDGGPYNVWLSQTKATSALFTGQPGKSYSFYSVATDGARNREDLPTPELAEATTAVAPLRLQFNAASYAVSEEAGVIQITVMRGGGNLDAASVAYATSDGTAQAGADYAATSGTLNFAVGQLTGSFNVPITDDALAEGGETINLILSNPTGGASLGSPFAAVLTINPSDNETAPRIIKQDVLAQLIMLRLTVMDKEDGKNLDAAIKSLSNSVDASLWVDDSHPRLKDGDKVFQVKETVKKLNELIKRRRSRISEAALQMHINRLVGADRMIAQVAINEALMRGGNTHKFSQALDELAKGDAEAARGDAESAIERYRKAWEQALKA